MEKENILYYKNGIRLAYGLFREPDIAGFNKPYLHAHTNACELLFILQGRGYIHVEGMGYPIRPGSIFVTRPGELHYTELDPSAPYERAVVRFRPDLFDSMDPQRHLLQSYMEREAGKRNQYIPAEYGDTGCTDLIRDILDSPDRTNILVCLIQLLHKINRFYTQDTGQVLQETPEYKIIRYINEHPQEHFTTQSLCEQFFISRTQLYRRFQRATGTSVGEYIATRRVLNAHSLILQGHPPTKVFAQCGFRDYSTFYRAYLRHFGYSPAQKDSTGTL